jgi:hypothetical protein
VPRMARGYIKIFRTYSYVDKNPVIDKVRTIMQDEGLFDQLTIASEISNVGRATMANWFHGPTRNPQHHTVAAVITAMGYEEQFVKKRAIDIERERKVAAEWTAKQPKPKKRSKPNGRRS